MMFTNKTFKAIFAILIGLLIYIEIFLLWNSSTLQSLKKFWKINDQYNYLIAVIITFLMFFILFKLKDIFLLIEKELEGEVAKVNLKYLEDLNNNLRMYKHDFLNHMQMIYGFLELGRFDEAKKYLESNLYELEKVKTIVTSNNVSVSALLNTKKKIADLKNINMECSITTTLDELSIEPWELTKILGNVIDNALEAVEKIADERRVIVNIWENEEFYVFRVKNNGGFIDESIIEKIYEKGFSTKARSKDERGYGLYIVKTTLEKYGGDLYVNYADDEYTVFDIVLPKERGGESNA